MLGLSSCAQIERFAETLELSGESMNIPGIPQICTSKSCKRYFTALLIQKCLQAQNQEQSGQSISKRFINLCFRILVHPSRRWVNHIEDLETSLFLSAGEHVNYIGFVPGA